jgi:hypothetical protein
MCTANAEEAATATTAGAEHSVVERAAPDLNTTQRTATISDLPQHRPRRTGRVECGHEIRAAVHTQVPTADCSVSSPKAQAAWPSASVAPSAPFAE